jgi:integrase
MPPETPISTEVSTSISNALLPLPTRADLQGEQPLQQGSTRSAYARDVERFVRTFGGTIPCTSEMLIAYIRASAKRIAPATLLRRCMAIQDAHVRASLLSPTRDPRIREAMRLMAKGQAPGNLLDDRHGGRGKGPSDCAQKPRGAKPISRALLMRMLDAMGAGTRSLDRRDRLILTLGFAGLKRGMICALNIEDVRFTDDAMLLRVGKKEGLTGRELPVPITRGPLCAATACKAWIEHNQLEGQQGPLIVRFTRSGEATDQRLDGAYVNYVVKGRLRAAGTENIAMYSAESLRAHRSR